MHFSELARHGTWWIRVKTRPLKMVFSRFLYTKPNCFAKDLQSLWARHTPCAAQFTCYCLPHAGWVQSCLVWALLQLLFWTIAHFEHTYCPVPVMAEFVFFSFRAVELITQSNPRIPPNTRFLVEYENSGAGGCCVFRHMVGFGLMDEEADSDASGVEMNNFLFPPGLVQQAFCAPAYYFCMF